jgi:uncharacterized protein YeaO (DUF488 family)
MAELEWQPLEPSPELKALIEQRERIWKEFRKALNAGLVTLPAAPELQREMYNQRMALARSQRG